jgi:hypothetical protein
MSGPKPAEPDDPMALVGVPVPADVEVWREMAYVFAEEFARLGYDEARLLALFRSPFYAGLHRAWRALGEAEIRAIVAECVHVWRPCSLSPSGGEGQGEGEAPPALDPHPDPLLERERGQRRG